MEEKRILFNNKTRQFIWHENLEPDGDIWYLITEKATEIEYKFYLCLLELKEKKPTRKMAEDVFYDCHKLLVNMVCRDLDLTYLKTAS